MTSLEKMPIDPQLDDTQLADMISTHLTNAITETSRIIYGQQEEIKQIIASILSGGHALLVGAPGLGKTKLVSTLATVMGLSAKRVQFTPDLMPADITGSEILDEDAQGKRSFRFIPGPAFCQLLMADEINRASPRTQSALLQAMQEKYISIAGKDYPLPAPFHVLATQNPIEQEGTYPLPEAQLDRFMVQVNLTYPDQTTEKAMLLATTGANESQAQQIITSDTLVKAQSLVRRLPIGENLVDSILRLVRNARPETSEDPFIQQNIAWGPGSRAAQALMLLVRARALLNGRLAPNQEDLIALAPAVLRHRIALTFTARAENIQLDDILKNLLNKAI
ncbi:MoxR-like ATPase (MoxR) (PDB:2R44) [Commensalibacter communis]|uniref:MoxR-like ATPase (MoxR) n=1 Tax=Commensalibacter communis TaxID=2972786 RepID=A0A9W4X5V4_9PROT|nr:MoxR-like ATPase (MoxR) (PDB:2R44) [Commensalibacter communis]CAI3925272.1 MoxR-like ATPase (MoxR) (PDB:2R44) [Commensalibacter communis]CAI3937173.1 MoxR-like ATPase (MoxR) (PDB:2R44) [Commensalibacter communis]CAI3937723.1 MoxR-like ATPase (MoxR) (PDB:2R44) [Commensalibacter communis]